MSNGLGLEVSVDITVVAPSQPTITQQVVDNNVLLQWNDCTATLPVATYELRRGAAWAGATLIGTKSGRFTSVFETVGGSYTYWLAGIDSAGNYGTPGSVVAVVNQPPDYVLRLDQNSAWSGTKNNALLTEGTLVLGLNLTETYEQHFEGADTATHPNWQFNSSVDGFTAGSASLAWDNGALVHTATGPDPVIVSPTVSINGASFPKLQIMIQRLAGSGWDGSLFYANAAHGFRELGKGIISDPAIAIGQYKLLEWNMASMPNQDWTTSTVTSFRLDLGLATPDAFRIEYIRVVPAAGAAAVKSRAWTTPQQQIDAGYPRWIMPSATAAFYEETVDYGTVLVSSKVAQTLTSTVVAGAFTVTPKISTRKLVTDAWTDYNGVDQVYATDFRYIKFRYDFASSGGDDLMVLTKLNYRLDSKLRNDFGTGTANSGDSGGTTVNLNVAFVDVEAISVTPSGTTPRIAIYDFVDAPNPVSFKVLLFDTSGNRVSGPFSWSARGV